MLFSSGNGRYYFTVRDGWGVEDNCLYALSIGAIRRDFKKPVTIEEIERGINNPEEPKSAYSALAIKMKLKDDKEIFAFSKLIYVISQYIPDTCTNDESENHLFTVTCMLAEALIDFATSADDIKTVEGETILKADGKDGSHKIMYYPDGMVTVYKNEPTGDSQFSEYNDGYLVYDFDIGDYSEFVDYANYIPENEEESEPDII
jgi:hypothetical protein